MSAPEMHAEPSVSAFFTMYSTLSALGGTLFHIGTYMYSRWDRAGGGGERARCAQATSHSVYFSFLSHLPSFCRSEARANEPMNPARRGTRVLVRNMSVMTKAHRVAILMLVPQEGSGMVWRGGKGS